MSATSPAPSLRAVRKLHSRNERKRTGLYLAEGIRPVAEALNANAVDAIYHAPELLTSELGKDLIAVAGRQGISVTRLSATEFTSIATRERPQGIAAVGQQVWHSLSQVNTRKGITVALYQPQDPGNLGSILRTCDAIGGAPVILIGDAVDPWHPGAIRSAMGATFVMPLVKCAPEVFVEWATRQHVPVIGTADRASADYAEYRYEQAFILLMGSERQGVPVALEAITTAMVRIPMAGKVDSLNLAVATSLMLYEARNQQARSSEPI